MIAKVSDREFDTVIARSAVPVLIQFWKPGCGGCRALTRQLEQLQTEVRGKVLILTMNVEENFQIPAELEVRSLPALALYRQGVFERFIGGLGTRAEIFRQLQLT